MKFSQESIILIIAALMVAALVVWKNRSTAQVVSPEAPIDNGAFSPAASPVYTSYNNVNEANGYNFGPPVVNAMPAQSQGIAGGIAAAFGCRSCG